MSLESELARFESLLTARYPDLLERMRPGLDDDGIEQLRDALSPMGLPSQVETLYRWRDGGAVAPFVGWQLRPLAELLEWRQHCLTLLEEPPAWLQLFGEQCLGFVTLQVPGFEPDEALWYGDYFNTELWQLFDSVETLVACCSDAIEAGRVNSEPWRLFLDDGRSVWWPEFTPFRLARCPGAYRYPDPPAGTSLENWPESDWPPAWLASRD